MKTDALLAQFEATGDEAIFREVEGQYEQLLSEARNDADLHLTYGCLLECRARN